MKLLPFDSLYFFYPKYISHLSNFDLEWRSYGLCNFWWFSCFHIWANQSQDFIPFKKNLKSKRNLLERLNRLDEKEEKKISEIETSTNKMVIYSFILNFFCRIPELAFKMFLIVIKYPKFEFNISSSFHFNIFSHVHLFCILYLCSILDNICQFLYIFNYITNIFFFYKFNRTFREGFKKYST